MKKNNNLLKIIILTIFYFIIIVFISSFFIFSFLNHSYATYQQSTENESTEIITEEETQTEQVENKNTLIEIERTNTYKILVDKDTRNMYIVSNGYKDGNIQLMYNGNEPKIYDGNLDDFE